MGKTKTEFKLFSIPQYKQEEEYLNTMHKNGWKFTKVTFPGFYQFEQCQPENVIYRLDYNKEGLANKSEYVQMFSDCGWEYMFDFVGYSYFCKVSDEVNSNEEIFCDDDSRLDMMKRVFKGRVVPLIVIFFGIIMPQLFMNSRGYGGGSVVQDVLSFLFLVSGLLYITLFGWFTIQYYKYEKSLYPENNLKIKYGCIFAGLIIGVLVMVGMILWSSLSNYKLIDGENGFTIEAELLNKAIVKEYELKTGDTVYVTHEGDGGELYISIGKENEKPVFYGNTYNEFGNFEVEIQEKGVYQIKCSGRKARGKIEVKVK